MSQLKAKQIKLPTAGDLLIGGTGGTGTTVSVAGNTDKILRVVSGAPAWSLNDHLSSANGFNTLAVADDTGITLGVQNSDGTATQTLAKFQAGSAADEAFTFSSAAGAVTIAATGTATDVDLILAPQGAGDVVIGNEGGGIIQADDGEDLALKGGDGAGNLYLNGGGTGKVYYGDDNQDANLEVATIGDVTASTAGATRTQTRNEFTGTDTFVLNTKTISDSIIAHINGLVIKDDYYAYSSSNQTLTFSGLPYTLDAVDQVVFTYEITA